MKTVLILSIRDVHAKNIFQGSKKVELRRIRPRLKGGDVVLVYTPRPVMALVGGFAVKDVIEAQPQKLWSLVGSVSGLSKDEFAKYYSGASKGFGICIGITWRLRKPLSLATLKQAWVKFVPPQGFRYLRANEVDLAISSRMNLLPNVKLYSVSRDRGAKNGVRGL